jgi:hypothetical protein
MLNFYEMIHLLEQEPPMGGAMPPPGPGGDMGGGMPPPGGMGPPGGAPGPMGGPPPPMGGGMPGMPGGGGGPESTEMKPSDVWHIINRILENKPINDKKSGGQQEKNNVNLDQQPAQPPELSQTADPASMGSPPMPAAPSQQMMGVSM